jgi:hypothetical protein
MSAGDTLELHRLLRYTTCSSVSSLLLAVVGGGDVVTKGADELLLDCGSRCLDDPILNDPAVYDGALDTGLVTASICISADGSFEVRRVLPRGSNPVILECVRPLDTDGWYEFVRRSLESSLVGTENVDGVVYDNGCAYSTEDGMWEP